MSSHGIDKQCLLTKINVDDPELRLTAIHSLISYPMDSTLKTTFVNKAALRY